MMAELPERGGWGGGGGGGWSQTQEHQKASCSMVRNLVAKKCNKDISYCEKK
jgi:hypothetical protein